MKIHLFLLTAAFLALLLGCKTGTGPEDPEKPIDHEIEHGITGTLTFTGQWPETPVELRLITSKAFPPEMDEIVYGDSIPFDSSSCTYQLELEPGTYKLVGIAWRAEGTDFDFPSLCGFYFSGKTAEDSLAPAPITIANETDVKDRINMKIDRSKARVISDAKIKGTVTFTGDWPDDVAEARVIATTRLDLDNMDLPTLNDLAIDNDRIPVGTTSYDYEIPAFPGTFLATFVIFFKNEGKLSTDDVLWSSDRGGFDEETTYKVELNKTVEGPDFSIEFF